MPRIDGSITDRSLEFLTVTRHWEVLLSEYSCQQSNLFCLKMVLSLKHCSLDPSATVECFEGGYIPVSLPPDFISSLLIKSRHGEWEHFNESLHVI